MAKKAVKNAKAGVGVGVGVGAALLSAAGAYFLYGAKNADKHRKMVKSWTLKAKADVLEGLEKAKDMTKEDYDQLIDKTVKSYGKLKGASAEEIAGFAKEMKAHWKSIEKKGEKHVVKPAVAAGETAQKVATKVAKKVTKKVAKTVAEVVPGAAAPKKAAKKTAKK